MFDETPEKSETIAFIKADYEEFDVTSYKAIVVKINEVETRFETHPFTAYRRAVEFAINNADRAIELSSLHNLAADLAKDASDDP